MRNNKGNKEKERETERQREREPESSNVLLQYCNK